MKEHFSKSLVPSIDEAPRTLLGLNAEKLQWLAATSKTDCNQT